MIIYLHLGVHKTATSSLQKSVFPNLPNDYLYLGVKYPRSSSQNSLYVSIMHVICRATKQEFCLEVEDIKLEFEQFSKNYKNIVISDELFSTGSAEHFGGEVSIQERIHRFSVLFDKNDVRVLLSIRKQCEAIFSLYIQKYNYLPKELKNFSNFYMKTDLLSYDYYQYINIIESELEPQAVIIANFHEISSGNFINSVYQWLQCDPLPNNSLGIVNSRKNKFESTGMPASFFLKSLLPSRISNKLAKSIIGRKFLKPLYRVLNNIKITKSKKIDRLSESDLNQIDLDFKNSNKLLKCTYSVDITE